MNVLITGVQNAVEESIVRLAVERVQGKVDFRFLSFSDFDGLDEGMISEIALVKETQQKVKRAVLARMTASGKGKVDVVVSGYCTVKTKLGFFPVLTTETVKAFRPDIMVHISVDPLAIEGKTVNVDEFKDHQSFEKTYALLLCASAGCGLKVIHCALDGARDAADELIALLKGTMVGK
jgi:adenylate kinase